MAPSARVRQLVTLVAVVTLGILAIGFVRQQLWVAGSRGLAETKEQLRTTKTALRDLVEAQDAYFYQHRRYSMELSALALHTPPGVSITIGTASETGWSATAAHQKQPRWVCATFVGSAQPRLEGFAEREPGCSER